MATGIVKWLNNTKGFGSIAPEGGTRDVFVHISAVERAGLTGLSDDQAVTFDTISGRDGRDAAENFQLALAALGCSLVRSWHLEGEPGCASS